MPPSPAQKRSAEERLRRYEAADKTSLLAYLHGRGLGAAVADRFRLGYVAPERDTPRQFWHRMAIPYLTPTGVVSLRYKCLAPHHDKTLGIDPGGCPKMLGETGDELTLYNASAVLHERGPVFLCEGEPDVWAITTLYGSPAVGIPGAEAWAKHSYWARCFVGLDLILPADGDKPGRDLAAAVKRDLPETRVVQLPDGDDALSVLARDPDEFAGYCGL